MSKKSTNKVVGVGAAVMAVTMVSGVTPAMAEEAPQVVDTNAEAPVVAKTDVVEAKATPTNESEAKANLDVATQEKEQARAELDAAKGETNEAQGKVDKAEKDLADAQAKQAEAQAKVDKAESDRVAAEKDLADAQAVANEQGVTEESVGEDKQAANAAVQNSIDKRLDANESQRACYEADDAMVEAKQDISDAKYPSEVASAEKDLAQARLEAAQGALDNANGISDVVERLTDAGITKAVDALQASLDSNETWKVSAAQKKVDGTNESIASKQAVDWDGQISKKQAEALAIAEEQLARLDAVERPEDQIDYTAKDLAQLKYCRQAAEALRIAATTGNKADADTARSMAAEALRQANQYKNLYDMADDIDGMGKLNDAASQLVATLQNAHNANAAIAELTGKVLPVSEADLAAVQAKSDMYRTEIADYEAVRAAINGGGDAAAAIQSIIAERQAELDAAQNAYDAAVAKATQVEAECDEASSVAQGKYDEAQAARTKANAVYNQKLQEAVQEASHDAIWGPLNIYHNHASVLNRVDGAARNVADLKLAAASAEDELAACKQAVADAQAAKDAADADVAAKQEALDGAKAKYDESVSAWNVAKVIYDGFAAASTSAEAKTVGEVPAPVVYNTMTTGKRAATPKTDDPFGLTALAMAGVGASLVAASRRKKLME